MRLYKDGITRDADDNATVNALLNAGYKKVEDAPAENEPDQGDGSAAENKSETSQTKAVATEKRGPGRPAAS